MQPSTPNRVLIAGASGGIGVALVRIMLPTGARIGAHYHTNQGPLAGLVAEHASDPAQLRVFSGDLSSQAACHRLVDDFVAWAGGIEALVQLTGNVAKPCHWQDLTEDLWSADINLNLAGPFFLAQRAMKYMRAAGGRIVLTSTASARHGGGASSIAYGVAKAGVECLTKALARDGAAHEILVNAVAPGLIDTEFHTKRMGRDEKALRERAAKVPLRRAGTPADVAGMIAYLLSPAGSFITGECIAISGGDWL